MKKAVAPLNYVYVKLKGSKQQPKKVILPQTLKALKQNCKIFEKGDNVVDKLLDDKGFVVEDVTRVKPGSTLDVVLIDKYKQKRNQNTNNNQVEELVAFDQAEGESFFVVSNEETSQDEKSEKDKEMNEEEEEEKEEKKSKKGSPRNLRNARAKRDSPIKGRPAERVVKLPRKGSPQQTLSPTVALKSFSRNRDKINMKEIKFEEEEEVPVEERSFDNALDVFLGTLPEDKQMEFINIYKLEITQRNIWLKACFSLVLGEDFTDHQPFNFYKEILDSIRSKVRRNCFIKGGSFLHEFNLFIYGPDKSGKSTFLEIASKEALMHLGIADEWKSFLVLPINFIKFMEVSKSPNDFLQTMVQYICRAICLEFPLYRPVTDEIVEYFSKLLTNPGKLILKRCPILDKTKNDIISSITDIGNLFVQIWNNSQSPYLWYQLIFDLPQLIGSAFGLKKVLFIIDNLDYADILLTPQQPLTDPMVGVNLLPIVKRALAQNQYIISCNTMEGFNNATMIIEEGDISLIPISTFVPTYGIIDNEQVGDKKLSIDIGKERNVIIDYNVLGGCPAFVIRFIHAMNFVDIADQTEGDEEKEDAICNARDIIENLIHTLYPQTKVSAKSFTIV